MASKTIRESHAYGWGFDVSRYSRLHIFSMTREQFNELIAVNPHFEPIEIHSHNWPANIFLAGEITESGDTEDYC